MEQHQVRSLWPQEMLLQEDRAQSLSEQALAMMLRLDPSISREAIVPAVMVDP
jgi:hypothetical protein